MALFDFIKGRKKDSDLSLGDLDKDLGMDLGLPELGEAPSQPESTASLGQTNPFGPPAQQSATSATKSPFRDQSSQEPSLTPTQLNRQVRELPTPGVPQSQNYNQQYDSDFNGGNSMFVIKKEVEVLSSKLDAIRSSLESMNQRLMNIERMAMYEQEKNRKSW